MWYTMKIEGHKMTGISDRTTLTPKARTISQRYANLIMEKSLS